MMKTKAQKIRQLESAATTLFKEIKEIQPYMERVEKLERRLWKLESPAEFKMTDRVRFTEAKKGSRLYGVFVITDVRLVKSSKGSCLPFEWHYSIMNMKAGAFRTCVVEYFLSKAE